MITNSQFFDDLHISYVSVVSGIRRYGRVIDNSVFGRKGSGILFVFSGEATFNVEDGKTLVASDNTLVFLPNHSKYKMTYSAESTTFVVVNFSLHDKNNEKIDLFSDIVTLGKDDPTRRFARIMTDFELCNTSKTACTILRKKELMYRLLRIIYASRFSLTQGREMDSQIVEGVTMLEQTYLENIPISEYAKASHVSENTFRNLVQKQFGLSPLKYRNYLRIERAKELLSEGGFSVAEVAYASGFENQGYFCKYYRMLTGESPGETKKKHELKN